MPFVVALLGLAVGSFLNVVIGRLRSGETGWRRRSRCPGCHAVLRPSELVPVVSFLLLRRRCRSCRMPISWQYPLVELAVMALFVASYAAAGSPDLAAADGWLAFVRNAVFVSALTVVFVIDLRDMVVFDAVTLPMVPVAFLFNLGLGVRPVSLILGAAVGAGFFLLQYAVSRGRWIGGGDVRIGAVMGMMLGFPGVLLAMFAAYVTGALTALGLMAAGKARWSGQMAFGTFLSVGTVFALFFGPSVISWYASLLAA